MQIFQQNKGQLNSLREKPFKTRKRYSETS